MGPMAGVNLLRYAFNIEASRAEIPLVAPD